MANITGTIYRSGGKVPIRFATIKVYKERHTLYTTTDQSGEFDIDLPEKGVWKIVVLEPSSFPSKPQELNMDIEQEPIKVYLDMIAGKEDEKAGKLFFWILIGVLILVISAYLLIHLYLVKPIGEFSIWTEDPLRLIEIFLWGFTGILVSKIITTGWYLRQRRFYRDGLLMHIAHIIATPILVLVVVLLLSEVSLSLTLAQNNEVTIDLSVPAIMVAFSFIIGTRAWPLWNFILDTAKRFTGQFD
jgi:hypothetical protein